ncbi:MAG: hypothetical protein K6G26_12785 [Lachnospiraceae bacterium]|nr:hypothetical protein [Lachnospiraceae bacterium]
MKNYFSKKWAIVLLFFTAMSVTYLSNTSALESYACNTFEGGNLVCYDQCVFDNEYTILEFPLISPYKINTLEYVSFEGLVNNFVNCDLTFNSDSLSKESDYFSYNFNLKISSKKDDITGYNCAITGINLLINGVEYFYETPNFKLFNTSYLTNNHKYIVDNSNIEINNISDDESDYFTCNGKQYTSQISTNCDEAVIVSIIPSDFFEFTSFTIDNEDVLFSQINKTANNKGFNINYSLAYTNDGCRKCTTKSALIIKYYYNSKTYFYINNNFFNTVAE